MRETLIAFFLLLFLLSGVSAPQEANCRVKRCPGKAPNDYNDGVFHFVTTSRVYRDGNNHIYETCVQNVGSQDLEVRWVIPLLESVVPKGCAVFAYRPQSRRKTLDTYGGCIRYGASWKWTRSPFFPHASEAPAIKAEKNRDCRETYKVKLAGELDSGPRDLSFRFERFAPSDDKYAKDTLSRIQFLLKTQVVDEDHAYSTTLKFAFTPAYKSQPKYYTKGFAIQPEGTRVGVDYFRNATGNPNGGFFDRAGSIGFTLPIPNKPVQRFVKYRVFSVDGKSVASVDVPIWLESQ